MKKLAIICTHPIQYYAPVFRLLAERKKVKIKVFYTWGEKSLKKYDPGFDKTIQWDIPLLEGYDYEFLTNTSKNPGSHHFRGIINNDAIQKINHFDPDAILVYGWSYQSHLQLIKYYGKRKIVLFRGDSHLLDESSFIKKSLRKFFLKWVYKEVDKVLYVGSASKAYFLEYGFKENQLFFAPHAIDNQRFSNVSIDLATEIRQKLSINDQDILILFVGKMEARKNPLLLLKAFQKVSLPHLHLLFLGSGYLDKILKADVNAKGTKNVHFIDFINQFSLPAYYHASDVFCLPSMIETWGLAVNEAMACRKAILVSDKVGCGIDLVKDGKNGYIFQNNNLPALADTLKKIADKNKTHEFGIKSKEIIQNWSIEIQVENIESSLADES